MTPAQRLAAWLAAHEHRVQRFRDPLPLAVVAEEAGLTDAVVSATMRDELVHHVWSHIHRKQPRPCKPFVLRESRPGAVGIDQEDSVVGAAEAEFRRRGFQTAREIGTAAHVATLSARPDLTKVVEGVNQRDLVALRRQGSSVELWIIEAKGKEAAEFDHYTVAEAMAQLFPVPAEPLSALLGAARSAGHGRCLEIASTLSAAWTTLGFTVTTTLALLLPYSAPDMVWKSSRAERVAAPLYLRPVEALQRFLAGGDSGRTGRFRYQQAYGAVLEHLEAVYGIRELASDTAQGLRFRLLLASPTVQGIDAAP